MKLAIAVALPFRKWNCILIASLCILFTIIFCGFTVAQENEPQPQPQKESNAGERSFSIFLENDIIAGDDDNYTSGLKLTWNRTKLKYFPEDAWAHKWLYPVVHRLGLGKEMKSAARDPHNIREAALTMSIGHNIYTPVDIDRPVPDEDDRPYAGVAYLELGYHQTENYQMDTIEIYGGVVGPAAFAEELQRSFHQLVDGKDPKGWDYQLKNEPVLGILYEYKRKMLFSSIASGIGHDLILHTGGGVGNAMTYYNIGFVGRWGYNIPDDFGTLPIRPASTFSTLLDENPLPGGTKGGGIHLFLSANGRAVIRNIFLDGNTFRDSRSVNKKPVVGDFMGGIGMYSGNFRVSLAYVYQTKTFDNQKDPQIFGSIKISMIY